MEVMDLDPIETLNILTEKALKNIKEYVIGLEWFDDGTETKEEVLRDKATNKAIEEYAIIHDLDNEELNWQYFDEVDQEVEKYLNENFKKILDIDTWECYYYDKKYDFETVTELKKYFNIVDDIEKP